MERILILIGLIFSTSIMGNEKQLYILGGGGEPVGDETIFDSSLKDLSNFVKSSDWKTTISFNGGHSKTEKIIKNNFKKGINGGDFVKLNYDVILKDIEDKLLKGTLKNGDQLMIILNTHGAKNNGEVSHSVAMARNAAKNLKNLQGATTVSLDSLRPIIELAKDKGVKLAFVDQSCYSGNSLNLPHTDACIISATGANHYSYSNSINFLGLSMSFDFSGKFNKLLKPGKSLEDIFLKARKSGNEPDFPMISSPAGLEIQKVLYELATPYLNDDIKDSDVIYSYAKIDEISCQAASHFNELMSVISTIENAKNISMSTEDFEQLKNALKAYRDYQVEHENLYKELSSISDQIKNDIKMNFPDKEHLFFESDGVSILNANYDNSIKVFQEFFDKETNVLSREVYQKILNDLSAKKKIAQEIKSKLSTENRSKIDKLKQIEESSSAYKYSSIVSKSMRKLYNALYKGNLKTENNPCRDFVL